MPGPTWRELKVSARILSMPPQCACCNGPSDTKLTVSHTRTTGVEVIRQNTGGWDFPYCRRCLAHMKAGAEIHQLEARADRRIRQIRGNARVDRLAIKQLLLGSLITAAVALVGGFCLGVIFAGIPGILLGVSQSSIRKVGVFLAIPFGIAIAIFAGRYA